VQITFQIGENERPKICNFQKSISSAV